jgi:hypothetical protein
MLMIQNLFEMLATGSLVKDTYHFCIQHVRSTPYGHSVHCSPMNPTAADLTVIGFSVSSFRENGEIIREDAVILLWAT